MQIINTTKGDLGLADGYVVPAKGAADIPANVLADAKKSPVVRAWFFGGMLVEGGKGKTEPAPKAEPAPAPARDEMIGDAIFELSSDDFTKTGKPDVDAINALMPEGQSKVTAAERDRIWSEIEAETD